MAGQIVAAYGQEVESKAAERAMEFNRQVAERNAKIAMDAAEAEAQIAEREGRIAKAAAEIRADDVRRHAERVQHEGRAIATRAGVVASEGSPLLVQIQTAREGEIAARRELYTGALQEMAAKDAAAQARYGGKIQHSAYQQEAKLIKFGIKVEQRVRMIRGMATALGAGYQAYRIGSAPAGQNTGASPNIGGSYAYGAYRQGEHSSFGGYSDLGVSLGGTSGGSAGAYAGMWT